MKITCVLSSYNRPNYVRHALSSVAGQTYQDYELLVYDDSSVMDINKAVSEFKFPSVKVFHTDVAPADRRGQNRLSINCNKALAEASGDIICWLCDDDYYFQNWFKDVVKFFSEPSNKGKNVVYGILVYSKSDTMVFNKAESRLFPTGPLKEPACQVDHNQVAHRKFTPPFAWPETTKALGNPDALYFKSISVGGNLFYPINTFAVVKRMHKKNLQKTINELGTPAGETVRE